MGSWDCSPYLIQKNTRILTTSDGIIDFTLNVNVSSLLLTFDIINIITKKATKGKAYIHIFYKITSFLISY
jgi:competence protein ComGF